MGFCSLPCWSICCMLMSITAVVILGIFAVHAGNHSHLLHIPSENYENAQISSLIGVGIYGFFALLSGSYLGVRAVLKHKKKGTGTDYGTGTSTREGQEMESRINEFEAHETSGGGGKNGGDVSPGGSDPLDTKTL